MRSGEFLRKPSTSTRLRSSHTPRRPQRLSVATRTSVVAVVSSMVRLPKVAELRATIRPENSSLREGLHPPTSENSVKRKSNFGESPFHAVGWIAASGRSIRSRTTEGRGALLRRPRGHYIGTEKKAGESHRRSLTA